MEQHLDLKKWSLSTAIRGNATIKIHKGKNYLRIFNTGTEKIILTYKEDIVVEDTQAKFLVSTFSGTNLNNSGGCFYINNNPVTLNGTVNMKITPPIGLHLTVTVPAQSAIEIHDIFLATKEKTEDLSVSCAADKDVLVITPDYPSTHNLYLCAFAHSRNREYVKEGLKIQVLSVNPYNWYQASYCMDGVDVLTGTYLDLKNLLSRKQYKVIIAHFVDENLYPIFDGYIQDERLIFICHGPECTFRFLTNRCRPYFTKALPEIDTNTRFDTKEFYARKYARKENVDWVFVSDYLRDFSQEMLGVEFCNAHVIHNTINEQLFPYRPKTAEDRKKILILRKFDNIRVHSVDMAVLAILELSRRDFFRDLTFEVYGDGNFYDTLVEPLRQFENVHLHQTFLPNDKVHEVHAQAGILLIPSRHDTQGVAMGEAASSGLVPVGSELPVTIDFMNQTENHTLTDPENPYALADVIERLYRNPEEYLEISRRMSKSVQERCNRKNTVVKEIDLVRRNILLAENTHFKLDVMPQAEPVLTIVVPAYNIESYLHKCIRSMLSHRNVQKTEIIIVNDGSKDRTSELAHQYEVLSNGIVRVIDKENGGHGSTINTGIAAARGKYFRLIDGDDWVDGENLAALVDKLELETADVVLTKGCYEYIEQAPLSNIISYDMLNEGTLYHFEDLLYPGYGFETYGPLLTTGNYRTEILRKAAFHISEKCPYVDMEFNSFALRYVDTLRYYDLDIYRYLIGREGQTISRDFWKTKYQNHRYVIINILKTIQNMPDYSAAKKKYVYGHITALMIDSQVFMYDQLCLWKEIDPFLEELAAWPEARDAGLAYIQKKGGDCAVILKHYHAKIEEDEVKPSPIIGGPNSASIPGSAQKPASAGKSWKRYAKRILKACTPYGIMRIYHKLKYPGGVYLQ